MQAPIRRKLFSGFLVLLFLLGASAIRAGGMEPAEMVLLNGRIATVDENRPEAEAMAVRGGLLVAVGNDDEVRPYIGPSTSVVDLGGKFAMPGFIEGHGHLLFLGQSKLELDLARTGNWDEITALVANAARKAEPGEWITGFGWHQEKWNTPPSPAVEGYPTNAALNLAAPDNPVILTHASGHGCIVNAKALEMAGIGKASEDPKGGRIVRDAQGNLTGVLLDEAQKSVSALHAAALEKRTPREIEDDSRKAIGLAVRDCQSKGVTSFQDAGSSFSTIDLYKKMAMEGSLGLRLWVMIGESNENLAKNISRYRTINFADKMLTVRAIKRFMDGALGSHTAWFLEPYSDLPSGEGLNVEPAAEILQTARIAVANGFQLCVHAIGDRACREVLNIYETVFKENPDKKDLRWRVEHAQHLSAADIPRFGRLGVIASMQAIHCTSDGPWVVKRLGAARAEEGAYVWRKLMDTGAVVTNGTDTPVEDVNPLPNFYAAVTRKMADGAAFYPEQRMTRLEALKAYTIRNAFAAFEEDSKGSLTPGKLADVVVLSENLLTCPEERIKDAKVLYTILGGRIVYRSENAAP
jgi:hypothetical protein